MGNTIPFSDPLTIPLFKDTKSFIDILIHDLIHRLFTQMDNLKKTKESWNYINKKYSQESFRTRIHIVLNAIIKHIYLKFYTKENLKKDIKWSQKLKDYKKSWEIVEKTDIKILSKSSKKE